MRCGTAPGSRCHPAYARLGAPGLHLRNMFHSVRVSCLSILLVMLVFWEVATRLQVAAACRVCRVRVLSLMAVSGADCMCGLP